METKYDQLLKVIFADDEEKTRKLLRISVGWQSIGHEPVGDAASASQAMELTGEKHPDVVITNIEMPYISGLESTQMLTKKYSQTMVVALTAHDLFQYAQKSVELDIKSFLLKPIRRAELIEVMKDVRTDIMGGHRAIFEFEGLKGGIAESRTLIIQDFLSSLSLNKVDQENLWDTIHYYDIPLRRDTEHYNVMVLMPEKHNDPGEDKLRGQQCMEVLSPAISRPTDVLLLKDIHQNLILLSQDKKINLMSYDTHFTVLTREKSSMGIHASCRDPVDSLEEIRYSCKQAYKNTTVANYSHNQAFFLSGRESNMGDLQELIQTLTEGLPLYLGVSSGDKVRQLVGMAYGTLKGLPQSSLSDYLVMSYSIVSVTLFTLSDNGIPYIEIYNTDHLPYEKILRLAGAEEIKKYISQFTDFTVCQIEEYMDKKNTMLVHRIVQYVNEHIDDSTLSLAKISKINYINNSYFGKTFKCAMGVNFMGYLVSIRIETAKKLLRGTGLRIYEVARSVGIEDPNYSSEFFKRHTQETPAQYRDRCQEALQVSFFLRL